MLLLSWQIVVWFVIFADREITQSLQRVQNLLNSKQFSGQLFNHTLRTKDTHIRFRYSSNPPCLHHMHCWNHDHYRYHPDYHKHITMMIIITTSQMILMITTTNILFLMIITTTCRPTHFQWNLLLPLNGERALCPHIIFRFVTTIIVVIVVTIIQPARWER